MITQPAITALPAVAMDPATAALPAVASEPATAALPAVATEPDTAALPAVAMDPATAALPAVESDPATAIEFCLSVTTAPACPMDDSGRGKTLLFVRTNTPFTSAFAAPLPTPVNCYRPQFDQFGP